jgi:hypothetical protein
VRAAAVSIVILVSALPATGAAAQSLRQERAFATQLQDAVRTQNREAVAGLIRYPARVTVHLRPQTVYLKDRPALIEMFDLVFTPQLRCAIASSREASAGAPQPQYSLLLARGVVSIAGGRIVAERSGRGMLVTRISSFGDMAARTGKPREVAFTGSQRTIQFGGRAPESGADTYIVAAGPRETVDAKLGGFPERTLALQVTRTGTGYRVDVVRRAPYCEPPVIPYLLTLTLNR